MKQPLLLILFFGLGIGSCYGQSPERSVLASAGSSLKSPEIEVDYTLGETVVQTFTVNNSFVTAGFHQSELLVTAIEPTADKAYCAVFPNPTIRYFTIQTSLPSPFRYELFSSRGIQVEEGNFSREATVDLTGQPSGAYLLRVTNIHSLASYSYRVVLR
jgi:hypothetical protein